jgi:hypothetical protein
MVKLEEGRKALFVFTERNMKGFIKQKIVVEVECETQFSTGEWMVMGLLKNPSVPAITSVKILSCTGPRPHQIPNEEDLVK